MKTAQFSILMLLSLGSHSHSCQIPMPKTTPNGVYPKVPKSAWAKVGCTGEIAYSPDGSRLAVVSSIGTFGYMTPRLARNLTCL